MNEKELQHFETDLLLEAILARYGYDFRQYSRASLNRRIRHRLLAFGFEHVAQLIPRVLHDPKFMDVLLGDLSIRTTEMFRDPEFFLAFRRLVMPHLKTYPFVKIWHPGCSTGEEVYSIAIVLHEEGYLKRSLLYATDFNNESLSIARQGIYSINQIRRWTDSYNRSGAKASFSDYYHANFNNAKMQGVLSERITTANHDLVRDKCFGEMNAIVCRNVLIYFNRELQDRVLGLLWESLCHRGFLCLGTKETLRTTAVEGRFELVAPRERIYRRL